MTVALNLMVRGFWIVFLTAANVAQVAAGHYWGALMVGFLISFTWWMNAHRAASPDVGVVRGAACYGVGGGLGTIAGMATVAWWYT